MKGKKIKFIILVITIITIFRSSGPLTEIKLIPASFAIALANNVFPQPGGPHNNTPVGVVNPKAVKCSECRTGA